MENIRQAIERAKWLVEQQGGNSSEAPRKQSKYGRDAYESKGAVRGETELDLLHLQSRRIIAFDGKNPHSRAFDILRTEVLRSMDAKGWKILGITSPTPSCGKTLTAINLALSMARQPERQMFLADLDLRQPQVASCLGLQCTEGVLGIVEGRADVESATIRARAGVARLDVLPTTSTPDSSDLLSSSAMKTLLQDIAGHGQSRIVIVDLPPLLAGNDVISILPELDCVLLVAAIGTSKVSEIEECNRHLQTTDVVRFVLNKVPEFATHYGYY
jgi:protein-tyrosine kinase